MPARGNTRRIIEASPRLILRFSFCSVRILPPRAFSTESPLPSYDTSTPTARSSQLINLPGRAVCPCVPHKRELLGSFLPPMPKLEVQALGPRGVCLATALSGLALLLWMHRRAQPHQGSPSISAAKPKLAPVCFRISNVPPGWNEGDLLQAFRSSNDSLDLATGQYQVSFYPACSGSSRTVLLNLQRPECSWNLQSNEDRLIRREGTDIVIDRHFHGLTPLNTPEGEIVAE